MMSRSCSLICLSAALLVGGSLGGCGGQGWDGWDGYGTAEGPSCPEHLYEFRGECFQPEDLCDVGIFISGACYELEQEVNINLHMISAKLTNKNVFTQRPWDDLDEGVLPDPYVEALMVDPLSPKWIKIGSTTKRQNTQAPTWDREPFLVMKPDQRLSTNIASLYNTNSWLSVWDLDEFPLPAEHMGDCKWDPTPIELAHGVIKAKNCYSMDEYRIGGKMLKGAESNIHELIIGITVE